MTKVLDLNSVPSFQSSVTGHSWFLAVCCVAPVTRFHVREGVRLGARGDVRWEVTFVLLDSLNMPFRREQQRRQAEEERRWRWIRLPEAQESGEVQNLQAHQQEAFRRPAVLPLKTGLPPSGLSPEGGAFLALTRTSYSGFGTDLTGVYVGMDYKQ